jgi:hypothetical protein
LTDRVDGLELPLNVRPRFSLSYENYRLFASLRRASANQQRSRAKIKSSELIKSWLMRLLFNLPSR